MAEPPPGDPPADSGPAEPTTDCGAAAASAEEPGTEILRSRVRASAPVPAHARRHDRRVVPDPTLDLPLDEHPGPPVDPWADAPPLPSWAPPTLVEPPAAPWPAPPPGGPPGDPPPADPRTAPTQATPPQAPPPRIRPAQARPFTTEPAQDRPTWIRPSWTRPLWTRPSRTRSARTRPSWARPGSTPPGGPPPGWVPPGPVPPPGWELRRRRRRWPRRLVLLLLLVGCCCGCPWYVAKPMWDQYPAVARTPPTAAGLQLRTDRASARTVAELRADVRGEHLLAEDTFAAVYSGWPGGQVTVFGATGFRLTPERDLAGELARLTDRFSLTDVRPVDAGPAGGHLRCGIGAAADDDLVLCGWADHGSLGVATFSAGSLADSAELLRELRATLITRA